MGNRVFGTSVGCMDGRLTRDVLAYASAHRIQFLDAPNRAGGFMTLEEEGPHRDLLLSEILTSIRGHGSRLVLLHSHEDCAADPDSEDGKGVRLALASTKLQDYLDHDSGIEEKIRIIAIYWHKIAEDHWSPTVVSDTFAGSANLPPYEPIAGD